MLLMALPAWPSPGEHPRPRLRKDIGGRTRLALACLMSWTEWALHHDEEGEQIVILACTRREDTTQIAQCLWSVQEKIVVQLCLVMSRDTGDTVVVVLQHSQSHVI